MMGKGEGKSRGKECVEDEGIEGRETKQTIRVVGGSYKER